MAVSVPAALVTLAYCADGWWLAHTYGTKPFDAKAWRAADPLKETVRGEMVWALTRRHLRRGMTPGEVETLLGPPSRSERGARGAGEWHYRLGFRSGYRIDPDILSVGFGTGGRVTGWAVWQS